MTKDISPMHFGASKSVFRNAHKLRVNETKAEKLLWERLCKNQMRGFRFRRQHPIFGYIVDFYCHKANLVVELDGGYHGLPEQKLYDEYRTQDLNDLGLHVLRFSNERVYNDIDRVVDSIKQCLSQ